MPSFEDEILVLHRYLHSRQPPSYQAHVQKKFSEIIKELTERVDFEAVTSENMEEIENKIEVDAHTKLKQSVYNWQPIEYTYQKGLTYLIARGGHNYAALYTILSEIKKRDPSFIPKTLFDFGSGVGSVSWVAMTLWPKSIKEYLGIEISEPMMKLAQKIINMSDTPIQNVFFKQYFPVASPSYDLIVSAFSLLELPTRRNRMETVLNLWRKTARYLVIVEEGTTAGFAIINEVREFFLRVVKSHTEKGMYKAFIFAPCPHQLPCPMFQTRDTACKFNASFFALPYWKMKKNHVLNTQFTYIVLKKGSDKTEEDEWPRLVQPVLKGSKRAICRMCTAEGNLQEITFTKSKHERPLFRCARKSHLGDRLPIKIFNDVNASETSDNLEMNDEELNSDNDDYDDDEEPIDKK
ncbi:methyltransferase-like protein 17, mitochondrial isoform X2 [Chelonus insularis]|nr:methyltransferase-like protein 17, mitochondrial isoform X2 [Chelonus insularis]